MSSVEQQKSLMAGSSKPKKRSRSKKKESKKKGIELSEPHVFFDEDKIKFKLLTYFLNCYKDKLMLNFKVEDAENMLMSAE